jgi:anti-anti-sigma factor
MEMKWNVEPRSAVGAVIRLEGRLDLLSAAAVKTMLSETVTQGRRHLVVDLAEVTSIDSSGLGALIGGLKATRLAGGDLRVARPNQQVQLVFSLTSLDRVLKPYVTLDEAASDFLE